jgi:bifunctional isochorismate lyase/aryl carrier protein
MPQASGLPPNRVGWQVAPQRAVLLIHDMQDYFLRFYGADNPLVAQLVANIARVRAWARAAGVPVVYTAQPTEQSASDRALLNDMWGPGLTTADPALRAVVKALAPEPQDTVLVKWRYSAFQRSPLQQMMQDWGRDQLLIVGVYAHIGCMTTALDAFMRDIQPFMLADAVADFSEDEHRMALKYVAGRCGAVLAVDQLPAARPPLTLDSVRQALLRCVEDSEFGDDDNLVDHGLDSVQVMALIADWERQGVRVSFEELARTPTLNAWWALLSGRGNTRLAA